MTSKNEKNIRKSAYFIKNTQRVYYNFIITRKIKNDKKKKKQYNEK